MGEEGAIGVIGEKGGLGVHCDCDCVHYHVQAQLRLHLVDIERPSPRLDRTYRVDEQ